MGTATLVGRVFDASGQIVVGARVELVDIERNTRDIAETNHSGVYAFPNTRPGHYRVTVSARGYRTAILTSLTIYVQDDIQQNFRMMPGPPLESVTMQANGTPTETTGAVGTVVEQTLVNELPLNGRSFQTLFQLTPGVVIAPTTFASQGQFSVNGQRTNTNYFIVDGVSANFSIAAGVTPGQTMGGSLPALTAFGGTNGLVSTDDVQEFAILTSTYSAEFGRMPGGQVSIVTRSGTNALHGQAFEFLRNDAFDANDWFANHNNLKRAALRQNDYGGVVGGPLLRDRSFFFLSYEGMQLRQPSSEQSDVPSLAVRKSAPIVFRPILNAYPLPNGPEDRNGLAHATYAFSNPSSLDTGSMRIDHHVGEALSMHARYDYSVSALEDRGAALNSLSTVTDTRFRLQTLTGALTYRLSSRFVNDLRFNWSKSYALGADHLDSFAGSIPLSPEVVLPSSVLNQPSLFQFLIALNAQQGQLSLGRNVANTQAQINVVDNLSLQLGTHLVKIGVDFRTLSPQINRASYQQQDVSAGLSSFLSDNIAFAGIGSSVPVRSTFVDDSVYLQDAWKPASRLSITAGIRWDYNPAPSARGDNGQQPVALNGIANLSTLSIAPSGTTLYRVSNENFGPRVGMAYQIRNHTGTETVIRGGVGIFYDQSSDSVGNALGGLAFPFSAQKSEFNVTFPLLPADALPPALTLSAPFAPVFAAASNLKLPITWQWNISLQQSLSKWNVLDVNYVGAADNHLLRTEEYVGGQAGVPVAFTQLLFTDNSGYSHYDAFQLRFQSQLKNAHMVAFYAISHSLDDVSTDTLFNGIPARFLNPRSDYAPSDFDIRHTATGEFDYALPATKTSNPLLHFISDWSANSIVIFRSSPPVNVVISRDIGFGTYDLRPDLVNGVPLYLQDATAPGGRVINPAALSIPIAQRQGTLGRNFFRGFPLFQMDLSLRKKFRFSDRLSLHTRIEAFNVLNRPNFAPPSGELGSVDAEGKFTSQNGFGVSQATFAQGLQSGTLSTFGSGFSPLYQIGSARSLQLVLKLEF